MDFCSIDTRNKKLNKKFEKTKRITKLNEQDQKEIREMIDKNINGSFTISDLQNQLPRYFGKKYYDNDEKPIFYGQCEKDQKFPIKIVKRHGDTLLGRSKLKKLYNTHSYRQILDFDQSGIWCPFSVKKTFFRTLEVQEIDGELFLQETSKKFFKKRSNNPNSNRNFKFEQRTDKKQRLKYI